MSVGILTRSFDSAEKFLYSGIQRQTSCLITDLHMPGLSGLELQQMLAKRAERIPIIFITAHNDAHLRRQAFRAGAVAFLSKPFDESVLLETLWAALKRTESNKSNDSIEKTDQGDENPFPCAIVTIRRSD
jgi:FixJ family two-component response regulator